MSFEFIKQKIEDILLIKPKTFFDERGAFLECFKQSEFRENGIDIDFCQINHSVSKRGVLRGLHYQRPPYSQAKLIKCIKGKILDVAVDIRKESKNFGKYVSVELSQENKNMLFIPEGFAHGFVVLDDEAELIYITSKEYEPSSEGGIIWNDEDIAIDWKIDFKPILSLKDKQFSTLRENKDLI